MNAPRPSLFACALRAVSPALLLALATLFCAAGLLVRHTSLVRQAGTVNDQIERARLVIAADTILLGNLAGRPLPQRVEVASRTYELDRDGERLYVSTVGGAFDAGVAASMLPGDSPRPLALHRSAECERTLRALAGGERLAAASWPRLRPGALRDAAVANRLLGFRRDAEIALRTFRSGTDREDYVLDPPPGSFSVGGDLLLVDGNLWIPEDRRLHLPRDLVVVVRGNVYLRGSLHVDGVGHLIVMTLCPKGDVVFRDCDASGGWSLGDSLVDAEAFAGAVEGGGGVWIGTPDTKRPVCCDAALLIEGELHLAATGIVNGPLSLRHDVTFGPDGQLRRDAGAEWTMAAGRAHLPAFEMVGVARPGPLEFLAR